MSLLWFITLVAVGFIAAVINVFAAGGSFLTLPVLLFLGLPATVANGTNRVGVLAQNASAALGFYRHQVLPVRWTAGVSLPALVGAAVGAWAALHIPEVAFRRVLAMVMLVMTLVTVLRRSFNGQPLEQVKSPQHPAMVVGYFLAGIYGGFLQAGVGFLLLALTSFAGFDLVRGNAIKVLTLLLMTVMALIVFAGAGQIDWTAGAALGIGNAIGAAVGVHFAILKGHKWLERVVTVTIIVFAILLWVTE